MRIHCRPPGFPCTCLSRDLLGQLTSHPGCLGLKSSQGCWTLGAKSRKVSGKLMNWSPYLASALRRQDRMGQRLGYQKVCLHFLLQLREKRSPGEQSGSPPVSRGLALNREGLMRFVAKQPHRSSVNTNPETRKNRACLCLKDI